MLCFHSLSSPLFISRSPLQISLRSDSQRNNAHDAPGFSCMYMNSLRRGLAWNNRPFGGMPQPQPPRGRRRWLASSFRFARRNPLSQAKVRAGDLKSNASLANPAAVSDTLDSVQAASKSVAPAARANPARELLAPASLQEHVHPRRQASHRQGLVRENPIPWRAAHLFLGLRPPR